MTLNRIHLYCSLIGLALLITTVVGLINSWHSDALIYGVGIAATFFLSIGQIVFYLQRIKSRGNIEARKV